MIQGLHATESGSGVPVVLLHAFPLTSAMWWAQHGALAEACHLVTPDLRGFGESPLGDDDPDLDLMADDVAALLDRLDLDRVVLGGVSMGGYVVMAFLRRHRERVRAVILADTKASADAEPARENRERIANAVLKEKSPRVLVTTLLPTLVGSTSIERRPEIVERLRDLVATTRPEAAAWAQRAMAGRPDSFGTLRAFDAPALVVVGEEDVVTPPPEAETMVEALPQGRLVRIPEAGHLAAAEDPGRFNDAVRAFVASL